MLTEQFRGQISRTSRNEFLYIPKSNRWHKKMYEDSVIFDVNYHINNHGIRRSVGGQKSPYEKNHFLLFGCSVVFGYGLDDEQTLSSIINQNSNKFEAYNLGFAGLGPGGILKSFQEFKKDSIRQKKGMALFFLPEFHYARMVPSIMQDFGFRSPRFDLVNKELVEKERSSFRHWISTNILRRSSFLKLIHFDYPKPSLKEVRITAKVIERLKKLYLEEYPSSQFSVVLYHPWKKKEEALIKKLLKEYEIDFFDLSKAFQVKGISKHEEHPSYSDNLKIYQIIKDHFVL